MSSETGKTKESNGSRLMQDLNEMHDSTMKMEEKLINAISRLDSGLLCPPATDATKVSENVSGLFPEALSLICKTKEKQCEVHRFINILLGML